MQIKPIGAIQLAFWLKNHLPGRWIFISGRIAGMKAAETARQ